MRSARNLPNWTVLLAMSTPKKAQAAVAALNGQELDGRALMVNLPRPREDRPGGGGRREFRCGGRNRY